MQTARLLRTFGAEVMQFPVLEISAQPNDIINTCLEDHIRHADALIFVSANAVQFGMPLIIAQGGLASKTKVFAIGQATAQALTEHNVGGVISPVAGDDSEGVLSLPQLQNVRGQQIVLVRGLSDTGGRTLLADALMARGARIWPLECYKRKAISAPPDQKAELSARLERREVHGFLILSVETLDSLLANIGAVAYFGLVALLVSHSRIATAAKARGFTRVHVLPMREDALPLALHQIKPILLAYQAE
jgi:uroporphyrinogen-III synthase